MAWYKHGLKPRKTLIAPVSAEERKARLLLHLHLVSLFPCISASKGRYWQFVIYSLFSVVMVYHSGVFLDPIQSWGFINHLWNGGIDFLPRAHQTEPIARLRPRRSASLPSLGLINSQLYFSDKYRGWKKLLCGEAARIPAAPRRLSQPCLVSFGSLEPQSHIYGAATQTVAQSNNCCLTFTILIVQLEQNGFVIFFCFLLFLSLLHV